MAELNSTNEENISLDNRRKTDNLNVKENEIERVKNESNKNDNSKEAKFINADDFNIRPENVEGESGKHGNISSAYVLLVIFIILLGISYVIKNKSSFKKNNFGEYSKIIQVVDAKNIDKIEILKAGKAVLIENHEGVWKIISQNGFIADQEAIGSLISEALDLNRYILASQNAEKFSDFEVDDAKGTNIKLYEDSKEIANFYIGKAGPDFDSTYFRLTGDNNVYLSKGYVRYYFDKDEWRDLVIYDFEAENATKIALKYRNVSDNVILEKIGDAWKIEGIEAKDADKSKVEQILNTLSKLRANDVEYNKTPKECGFGSAPLAVRLELADGGKRNLIIGGKPSDEEDKYYAKREEDDTIYILNKTTVDNLMKKAGDF
ncbi:MAG: DUF4340 domain-containing protein [bacterium]